MYIHTVAELATTENRIITLASLKLCQQQPQELLYKVFFY